MTRAAGLAAAAMLVAACEQSPPARAVGAPPTARAQVVASFYPLQEFARRVAGDTAEVSALVPTGVEPHDWAPSPEDIARVARARVFVKNGGGLEPWADKLLANLGDKGPRVIDATAGIDLLDGDPHVWLDPVLAQAQVETIRAGLTAADPAGAGAHAAGAAALKAELAALHARFQQGLAGARGARSSFARRVRLPGAALPSAAGADHGALARRRAEPGRAGADRPVREQPRRHARLLRSLVGRSSPTRSPARSAPGRWSLNPIEGVTREEAAAGKGYVALMEGNLESLRVGLQCR